MSSQRKFLLFIAILYTVLASYLLSLFLFPSSPVAQGQSLWVTSIFLTFSFLLLALVLYGLVIFCYWKLRRMRWFRPKLGKILVSKGYLTEGELKAALSEQRLRIGEVLVQAGHISPQQLNQALNYQKKVSRKLGEILRELGHATEKDISWTLNRKDRKLGKILREKGLLTDRELYRLLALQRYGPR
jgi:DNA-binding transcriptional ArsR family regulator